jgi:hypothetical protein
MAPQHLSAVSVISFERAQCVSALNKVIRPISVAYRNNWTRILASTLLRPEVLTLLAL